MPPQQTSTALAAGIMLETSPPPPDRLRLDATMQLHAAAQRLAAERPSDVAQAIRAAEETLTAEQRSFGGLKQLHVALSALLLDAAGADLLRRTAGALNSVVEKTMDWLFADRRRLAEHFADHARVFPYLAKTRGCHAWQGFSRYDAVVMPDGRLRIIELNTGCPAGFMQADLFTQATAAALQSLGLLSRDARFDSAAIEPQALIDGLLQLERQANIEPGLIGILTDENHLLLELDLIREQFRRRGRDAEILDARTLAFRDGRLWTGERPISLTHNKFRVSVPTSQNHCWRDGFEARYADLLAAATAQAFVSVNNLAAQTISEDKGILAMFRRPEVDALLTEHERAFVREHVAWTTRLVDSPVWFDGREQSLLALVRRERERFVIKPSNEGRGFGVHVGRECPPDLWEQVSVPDPATPRVVQEYVPAAELFVAHERNGTAECRTMYLTLGLSCIAGHYRGILSRVSTNRVTNVARDGMVQAALVAL